MTMENACKIYVIYREETFCKGKKYSIRKCISIAIRYLEIRIKEYELVVLILIDSIKERERHQVLVFMELKIKNHHISSNL